VSKIAVEKYILALPLIMHGLANLAGVVVPWTVNLSGFADAPWLFKGGVRLRSMGGRASSLLWLLSTLMLIASGVGLLMDQTWWVTLAILGAAFSLAVIFLWWKAVPPGARFGAFFDAILLVVLTAPLREQILGWVD
jgi:hypothetical protein